MIETDVAMQLKRTHQRITQMMKEKIDEYELNFRLLHIMMLIDKNPYASQKELSEEMRFTQGAMSSSVKRLIDLNMIEQIPLELDMRYNRLAITKEGESIINDYKEHIFMKYRDMFIGFNEDELSELNNYLSKINLNLDQMNNQNDTRNLEE